MLVVVGIQTSRFVKQWMGVPYATQMGDQDRLLWQPLCIEFDQCSYDQDTLELKLLPFLGDGSLFLGTL